MKLDKCYLKWSKEDENEDENDVNKVKLPVYLNLKDREVVLFDVEFESIASLSQQTITQMSICIGAS